MPRAMTTATAPTPVTEETGHCRRVNPPAAAPRANPNWTKELLRLSTTEAASGAASTRLVFSVGPQAHAAVAQTIKRITAGTAPIGARARTARVTSCTRIPPTRVAEAPSRSQRTPPNFEPTRLASPRPSKMRLRVWLSKSGMLRSEEPHTYSQLNTR